LKGVAKLKKKVTAATAASIDNSGASLRLLSGDDQAARNGPRDARSAPARSVRWVGLKRVSSPDSTPNTVCQAMSPTAPAAKIASPTTARPYPCGTDARHGRTLDRFQSMSESTHAAETT
jgi:hypothetical protein